MHAFLSSAFSLALSPLNWIILLLAGSFIFKNAGIRKGMRICALVIFIAFGNHWLLSRLVSKWQPGPVPPERLAHYSCGIITGGFGSPDASGNGFFNISADRFIQMSKLYKLGKVSYILITGGNGKINSKAFREAGWAKKEFMAIGIPDSVIIAEDHSANTAENAQNAKRILDSAGLHPPYILVTSAMHMPRASLLFSKAGVPVRPFPCNYTEGRDSFSWDDLLPRPSVLLDWNPYLKEIFAYTWYAGK